jgi:hypothetical protein
MLEGFCGELLCSLPGFENLCYDRLFGVIRISESYPVTYDQIRTVKRIPISNRSPLASTLPIGIRWILAPLSPTPVSIAVGSLASPRLIYSASPFFPSSSATLARVFFCSVKSFVEIPAEQQHPERFATHLRYNVEHY